jgi:MFS family permease
VLRAYRPVLAVPGSLRLFASALMARMPQGMSTLAILLLVRDATHSYPAAGAAVGAFTFATAAMAPVQGRLVDRIGRLRVLAPAAIAQAILLGGLVLAARDHATPWLLVCVAGAAGAFLPPIAPTVRALLREVMVDPMVRERAYALESIAQELVWIAGPLVVALVISFASPTVAVLLLGAVCVAGTLFFLRSPLAADDRRAREGPAASTSRALASASLRALLAPIALTGVALGATEVGLPSLALHAGSRSASGLLLALWSIGSISGGLWFGSRSWNSSLATRYRTLLVIAVLISAPLVVARSIPVGVVCSLLAGLAIAPVFSCQYALVGRAAKAGTETEAFTWVTAALVGGLAAGSAAGGAVIAAGVGAPFVLSCVAMALAAVLALGVREEAGSRFVESSGSGPDLRPLRLVRPLRGLIIRQRLR